MKTQPALADVSYVVKEYIGTLKCFSSFKLYDLPLKVQVWVRTVW